MSSRRAFLAAPLLALGGCGFQPVYGPGGERNAAAGPAGRDPRLRDEMAAVRVAPMYERSGQLMRRALQRSFEGSQPGQQGRYALDVSLVYATEFLGYQTSGLATRVRVIATSNWVLSTLSVPPEVVDRGTVRTVDAYNLPDLQFFASDASREDMERRVIAELSERVTIGVAVALRRRLAASQAA